MHDHMVYMDYAATTPVDPRVAEAMFTYLTPSGIFANPASSHAMGRAARESVETARAEIAAVLGCAAECIVFTSGATESDNLAIKGVARGMRKRGQHIISEKTGHKAVVDACKALEKEGFEVTWLTPDEQGVISPQQVRDALREDTTLVSLLHANNETGVVQDIAAIGEVVRDHGAAFHVDAAQSTGKLPLELEALPVDLLSASGHKFYGPKGIGLLYRRKPEPGRRIRIEPLQHGGGHELGLRSGTLATHQIVGIGRALAIAAEEMEEEVPRLVALRERLTNGLLAVGDVLLNGHPESRLPTIVNVSVAGVEGESLQLALRDIALSTGSACNSASGESSFVLRALGRDDALAGSSFRFSIGRWTSEGEIDLVVERFAEEVRRLRELAPAPLTA
ncbi:MAG: aminotransferase class V-fold PLP-dependent enzyme [Gammaproteobacteria bacterium]|nr:aminotransferase class V-fold PLP-dependent enzyme [Gammaproteobacteria bacterium]